MLTNLTFLPDILNEYKNITNKFNLTNESYILAVDALSTTPFVNIKKIISATGLMTNEIGITKSSKFGLLTFFSQFFFLFSFFIREFLN